MVLIWLLFLESMYFTRKERFREVYYTHHWHFVKFWYYFNRYCVIFAYIYQLTGLKYLRLKCIALVIIGIIPNWNIKFAKLWTHLFLSKSRRFILKSPSTTSLLVTSFLDKMLFIFFSNSVVSPFGGRYFIHGLIS